ASRRGCASFGRIMTGRPWSVAQESGNHLHMLPPRRPLKTASVDLIPLFESIQALACLFHPPGTLVKRCSQEASDTHREIARASLQDLFGFFIAAGSVVEVSQVERVPEFLWAFFVQRRDKSDQVVHVGNQACGQNANLGSAFCQPVVCNVS